MYDLTATSTITVNKSIKIIAESLVTISRGNTTGNTSFTDVFFKVETSGSLELEGKENSTITLDGGKANETSIEAEAPLITSSGNLTLTNCTLQNNTLNNTVQGIGNGGAVYVSGGTFTMNNSSIIDCSANVNGGAVYITDGGIFTMNDDAYIRNCNATNSGGGVWMNRGSSFTMSGGEIDSCYSGFEGGGVYVTGEDNQCTFKMLDSATITGCGAVNGGAVYVSGGTFTMNNLGTISYCNAKDGGAVYITDGGTFTMKDGASISNCNATKSGGGDGGGVWMNSGSSFTMSGGKIERCNSDFNGGGVYVTTDSSNPCTLDNASITECSADNGGGIYLYGKLTMNGGTILCNSANSGVGVYVKYDNNVLSSLSMSGNVVVDYNDDVYLESGATVTVAGELTVEKVARITPENYDEGTQVLTADDATLLAQSVDKFALSDGTYSIGSDGNIVASNQSSAIPLTQDYLKGKDNTNTSGDFYYELEAGEYCVSDNLILEYPIQINAASGGEVKLYADGDYTISCVANFDNFANSAMIVLPESAGTLTLGGGAENLTIDGGNVSGMQTLISVNSDSILNLQDNCTITNGNVLYGAVSIVGGTFNMTGGEIKNNKATQSSYSGIYVHGNIDITGGSICDNYAMETNYGASIYNQKSDDITVLDQTISANGGHFTKNIIDGKVEEVTTSGGGNESLIQGAYYVSANGNDSNDGLTAEEPLLTLSSAIEKANNNSDSKTVYVIGELVGDEASYSGFYISDAVGTNNSPINIIGYPDGIDDVLTVGDNAGRRVVYVNSNSYITFKDLTITGGNVNQSGSAMNLTNCTVTLDNVTITGNSSSSSCTFGSNTYYSNGIEVGSNCTLNIIKSSIKNNIRVNGASNSPADVTIGTECYVSNIYLVSDSSTCTFDSNMIIDGNVYICSTSANPPVPAIYLSSSLSNYSSDNRIIITYEDCSIVENKQLIYLKDGANFNLSEEVKKFTLSDTNYTISDDGKVVQNSGGV